MLIISTWLWGHKKYSAQDVAKLASAVRRNLKQPHRFVCFTNRAFDEIHGVERAEIPDPFLTQVLGCFARLRAFDPAFQEKLGLVDRLVTIDLDTVITGELDPLFDRPEKFVILQGGNSSNPCPFNGALQMLRPGAHPEVWRDFSFDRAREVPYHAYPDDQGWLWFKVRHAAAWRCGPESGVYVFRKPGWPEWQNEKRHKPTNDALPEGARIVTFSGWRSPDKFRHLDWVQHHWEFGGFAEDHGE